MPTPYQPVAVQPAQGGDLNTRFSPENVGPSNYVEKRDWRRFQDAECRREGDTLFWPSKNLPLGNQPYPEAGSTNPITLIHSTRSANGNSAVIVGTPKALYRYFAFEDGSIYTSDVYQSDVYQDVSGNWLQIAAGFSGSGHRWEAQEVAGYCIFNNGYDLPLIYNLGWLQARPLYELREQGIAAIGTISQLNGMSICLDTSNMTPDYQTSAFAGISSDAITATQSGFFVSASANFFTADMVGKTITWSTGNPAVITTYTSPISVLVDISQTVAGAAFQVATLFGAAQDQSQISRVRWNTVNSDVGFPANFGSIFDATIVPGSTKINLSQPAYSLNQGDEVIVSGIGVGGTDITANIVAVDSTFHNWIYIDQPSQLNANSAVFAVVDSGVPNNNYQWYLNGSPLSDGPNRFGSLSATLKLLNPSVSDIGGYTVVITNTHGSITSSTATLTLNSVYGAPEFITQPTNQQVVQNSSATFTAEATGSPTPSYQWNLNGSPIPNAVSSAYTIANAQSYHAGSYTVTVSNSGGSTASTPATLIVTPINGGPVISVQPLPVVVAPRAAFSISVTAIGANLVYQWNRNGSPVGGANSATYTQNDAQDILDTGAYTCTVSNTIDSITSAPAQVTVTAGAAPLIITQPVNVTVPSGTSTTVEKSSYPGGAMGSIPLQDDGSAILRAIGLQGRLVVMKQTGIFVGSFTGDATNPIAYQKVYDGPDCLFWQWLCSNVDGTHLIYASEKDFFEFDLSTLIPSKHPKLNLCSNLFYGVVNDPSLMDRCFLFPNETTRELWIIYPSTGPDYGICYDYEWHTCSTLGTPYSAGATVDFPNGTVPPDRVAILGTSGGTLLQYGVDLLTGSFWTRQGSTYTSSIMSGYVSFDDEYNEKDLRAYVAFIRKLAPFTVNLYGARNGNEATSLLCTVPISSPSYQTLIPTYFRQNYFQDEIVVSGSDQNCEIVRRLFDPAKVDSRSFIKHS